AFLLKYAYDHTRVPPEWRIIAVAFGGAALSAIGWRLRTKRTGYAFALQGAGVGVLYLTVFAALRLYQLLPAGLAFGLLAALAAAAAALALLQNAQSLAVLAVSGGFLAPLLASTGSGNHVGLFAYYAILNAGIVAIAARRAWRPLNLVGFAFTFGIGALWGAKYYEPALWASTQPFHALFFVMYLAIPTLFARASVERVDRALDGTLVFGVPIIAFAMQVRLVSHFEYGAAISAVLVSLLYLLAARIARTRPAGAVPMLVLSFAALCIAFATLAIPLAFDAGWTSAAWALEGAALVWVGIRQQRRLVRISGYGLQLVAWVAFVEGHRRGVDAIPILNRECLGYGVLAGAALFTALQLWRARSAVTPWEKWIRIAAVIIGVLWWAAAGAEEISALLDAREGLPVLLAFIALSGLVFDRLGDRLDWREGRWPGLALAPAAAIVLFMQAWEVHHAFAGFGWIPWPLLFVVHVHVLHRRNADGSARVLHGLHVLGFWLLVLVSAWEVSWLAAQAGDAASAWRYAGWLAAVAALLALLVTRGRQLAWPVQAHAVAYLQTAGGGVAVVLLAAIAVLSFESTGGAAPLPYVPVLNPMDLAILGALGAVYLWHRAWMQTEPGNGLARHRRAKWSVYGAIAFIAANGMLLRALHQWAGVPRDPDGLLHSMLAQAAFSIFWTALSLVLMITAHRLRLRVLWLTGAGLLAVTVLKLFLVDLSNAGGVERIVSFLVVGVLMLVVGYFAPVPPARESER
ncbi:MAG: DUF2339 domain-containing protein, partial [Burkholderiales bacterium]|nr:DUF2339 domain-containing protein [Burkholderiales bacterium]